MTGQWGWLTGGIALAVAIAIGIVAWRLPGRCT